MYRYFCEKNSKEPLKAGRLNLESPNGDTIFNLGGTDGSAGSEFSYIKNSKRTQVHDVASKTTVLFPQKNGTLAIREDNYTKTEVDAKINSAKWITNKLANGWLKDPSTSMIIQWGNIPKDVHSTNFPIGFPNAVFSAVSQCVNSNTTLAPNASAIYDLSVSGFNLRWGNLGGNAPFAGVYTRWIAIGW